MTADDCARIVECLPVIRQIARGKPVFFAFFRYDGHFLGWEPTNKILLGPLHNGAYVCKPRYKINGKGKRVEVPYPEQLNRENRRRQRKGKKL